LGQDGRRTTAGTANVTRGRPRRQGRIGVEVKIGVQQAAREVVLMSPQTPDEVVELVSSAIKDGTPLTLGDDKGRTVVVPGDKIAYVEVGAGERGRLGFSQTSS
jgi:hypothetical protein